MLPPQLQSCIEGLFITETSLSAKSRVTPQVGSTAGSHWVDRVHLRATIDGLNTTEGIDLIRQLYNAAKDDFRALRPRISHACASQQLQPLITCVHGLKGCVLSIGWTRLGERCVTILHSLRENRFTSWSELPEELDELFRISSTQLEAVLSAKSFEDLPSSPRQDEASHK